MIGIFASVLIAYKWDEWPIQQMDLSQHIAQLEERGKAYRSGDFISISFLRFEDWLKSFGTSEWSYLANLVSMVILGFGISNRFDFEKLNKEFMAKLAAMAWMLGAAISVAVRVFIPIYVLQADVLAIAYASSWLLLANRWQNSSLISFFEKAGSVSLTIYLLETVVFISVFYGSGLGWLDRLGVFECLLLAAGTFLLLVILLRAWLKFFLMGPFEWMWRSFAEMRLLPIWR
ncbi:MAG: DUF418 domain-containing protein [Sandaracinaceae bacterium]|nr:DUF418 domain-containing protein [Sandaracinaceae bacterium]